MATSTQNLYSRRDLLKGTGALVVAFSLAAHRRPVAASRMNQADGLWPQVPVDQLDSWLAVTDDGRVTVYSGKIDMGTGVQTAFGQIVADELDVPFLSVEVVMGDTALTPNEGKSTASRGIALGGAALRQAAADARQILLGLAAERLAAPVERLFVTDGVVKVLGDSSASVRYADLVAGRRFDAQLTVAETTSWGPVLVGRAKPKEPGAYQIVGRPIARVDIPGKVTGQFTYVQDVRMEGMRHGRVVRPAAVGAELVSLDEDSVRHIPGVRVVREGNFVGVVAEREEDAIIAASELRVEWSEWAGLPPYEDLFAAVRSTPVIEREVAEELERQVVEAGTVDPVFGSAVTWLEATYEFPFQLHAMIGPSCAVADVQDDRATIWSGTQWPAQTRTDVAQMLGLPDENVRVIWVEESGSYGRLAAADAAADAALLSRAVGAPVRVQWMRHDEHGWEPLSPPVLMDLRGGLDAQGNVVAWELERWTASHATAEIGNLLAWRLLGTAPGHDRLSGGGGSYPYLFKSTRWITNYVGPMLRAIYLRSPGGFQSIWAMESFVDELAVAAGADPVEFRLRHLDEPRAIAVLEAVARLADWQPGRGRASEDGAEIAAGRGVALADYGVDSRVAMIADVEVNRASGQVRVQRVFVAHDCGLIINPAGVRHQIHGNVIQATSRTLLEEAKFDRSRITSLDWASYPILTFPEIPDIQIELIDRPEVPSSSVGEVGTAPVAGMIGNAIFDATGVRLRTIPFTPDRVKAALEANA